MIVSIRSADPASSTKVVPSWVQKLSHSSSNVLWQLGQRFISEGELFIEVHQKAEAVNQNDENQQNEIGNSSGHACNREALATRFFRVLLNLRQLIAAEPNRKRRRYDADIATPTYGHTENAETHRNYRQALLWRGNHWWGKRNLPRR